MASYKGVCFYCSPREFEEMGGKRTMTFFDTITVKDAKKIRDYYDTQEDKCVFLASILTSAATAILHPFISVIVGGISSVTYTALFENLIDEDKIFDKIDGDCTIKGTYRYAQVSSNDGVFYLSSVKVVD